MKLSLSLPALFLFTSSLFSANILYVDPASQNVTQGDTFDISIRIDEVIDLTSYQFDLFYNASLVSLNTIIAGTILDPIGTSFISGMDDGLGTIFMTAGAGSGAGGVNATNGLLATFRFNANSVGTATFSLDQILLTNSSQGSNVILPGDPLGGEAIIGPSTVVPEPSSVVLLSSGVFAALYLGRRRRSL